MHVNFGEDRLRGFGVARGQILAFSIKTLALPCECVIRKLSMQIVTSLFVVSRLNLAKEHHYITSVLPRYDFGMLLSCTL